MIDREEVLQRALALPPVDRAFVVAALEESLLAIASNTDLSAAKLLAELERRSVAFRAGETNARPAVDVLADQRQRQAGGSQA